MKNLLLLISLLVIACGGSDNNASTEVKSQKKVSNNRTSCLVKYAEEPCTILSVEAIKELGEISQEISEKQPHKMIKQTFMKMCIYNWEAGRKEVVKVMKTQIEVPFASNIRVGALRILDKETLSDGRLTKVEYFNRRFKTMTEEDKAKAKEILDKNTTDLKSSEKALSNRILDAASNMKFEAIEGLGDMASRENSRKSAEASVHVMHGNVIFTVMANATEDQENNFAIAQKVARAVLAKCN